MLNTLHVLHSGYNGILPLVIISLDGFAASYLSRNITPALHKLMSCGSRLKSLRPSFPSITFPNHYSIATGLHLESHGIVDNKFFDPDLRRSFHYKEGDAGPNADPVWWKGEPLWVTAKKQGKRVITYYWPGNEVWLSLQSHLQSQCRRALQTLLKVCYPCRTSYCNQCLHF